MADQSPCGNGCGPPAPEPADVSRRHFMGTLGISAAAGSLSSGARAAVVEHQTQDADAVPIIGPEPTRMALRINGRLTETTVEPATTLLETLRVHLDLTGSKEICDRGACGGCSVLVDGTLVASCMMLAADARGREITTIEGIAPDGELDTLQEAFVRHDALQCGFCTPGLIIAARALLASNPKPTLDDIKQGLSGNLCRCGTYTNIFNAVLDASGQPPIADSGGRP